jgi:hypothetical protein
MNRLRVNCSVACFAVLCLFASQYTLAQTIPSSAVSASPELVGQLSKQLSISPTQAAGGAGTLFGLAKSRLSGADFSKVADAVPGMGNLLKAAPQPDNTSTSGLSSLTGSLPGGIGGMASMASFEKLGLSPDMVSKFVPIMTSFVQSKGGSSTASLLSGVLK